METSTTIQANGVYNESDNTQEDEGDAIVDSG